MRVEIDGSHVTASAGKEDEGSHDQQRRKEQHIDPSHTLTTIDPWSRIVWLVLSSDPVAPVMGRPSTTLPFPGIFRNILRDKF